MAHFTIKFSNQTSRSTYVEGDAGIGTKHSSDAAADGLAQCIAHDCELSGMCGPPTNSTEAAIELGRDARVAGDNRVLAIAEGDWVKSRGPFDMSEWSRMKVRDGLTAPSSVLASDDSWGVPGSFLGDEWGCCVR